MLLLQQQLLLLLRLLTYHVSKEITYSFEIEWKILFVSIDYNVLGQWITTHWHRQLCAYKTRVLVGTLMKNNTVLWVFFFRSTTWPFLTRMYLDGNIFITFDLRYQLFDRNKLFQRDFNYLNTYVYESA